VWYNKNVGREERLPKEQWATDSLPSQSQSDVAQLNEKNA
jgi:hypothetical protein